MCTVVECHFRKQIYANIFTISFFFLTWTRNEVLESDLIECFLLLSLFTFFFLSRPTFNRLLLPVSFKMRFYDLFAMCNACQRNRSNHTMCFTWMDCASFTMFFFFSLSFWAFNEICFFLSFFSSLCEDLKSCWGSIYFARITEHR